METNERNEATQTTRCEGCDEVCETRRYRVTFTDDKTADVSYCVDCADLARMNWNGETKAIAPA